MSLICLRKSSHHLQHALKRSLLISAYQFNFSDTLQRLHIPITEEQQKIMLKKIGKLNESDLIKESISIGLMNSPKQNIPTHRIPELLSRFNFMINSNKMHRCHIGQGFYNCQVPAVVKRTVLENPMWYTAYTPYQAEISQGRLEALFNYQIMIKRITNMEIANACLLDEASAAAEAALMVLRIHSHKKNVLLVLKSVFKNTKAVVKSTVDEIGVHLIEVDEITDALIAEHKDNLMGFIGQSPDMFGIIHDFTKDVKKVQNAGGLAIIGTDLLACIIAKTPGEMGADIVYGNGQRFGTPMGYGGPHAAFFATKAIHLRKMPGRIISACKDVHGNIGYRMAVQTREQHIRRGASTSNICTSQVLLANLNFFYGMYHGEQGLVEMAIRIHSLAVETQCLLTKLGIEVVRHPTLKGVTHFDTITIKTDKAEDTVRALNKVGIAVYLIDNNHFSFSFDELSISAHKSSLIRWIPKFLIGRTVDTSTNQLKIERKFALLEPTLRRKNDRIFKESDIFNKYNGEHELLRYITRLGGKDITLCNSMIPLGSCTMKLNSGFEMEGLSNSRLNIHPYSNLIFVKGYLRMFKELSKNLCFLTGMDGVTYQSNSGSMGEYIGLKVMKKYHESRNEGHRNIVLIPSSAHGTNPASAAKIGLEIVGVGSDSHGYVDIEDLKQKIAENKDKLFGMMLTYPSTHGVFEESTRYMTEAIHQAGGQVYIDGANMNAQLGLTSPGFIGGDVCHLNLHKTFAIPHGGGGPGMGPVLVKKHLMEFLPVHAEFELCAYNSNGEPFKPSGPQTLSSPFGSASILAISHLYIIGMSRNGLVNCSKTAIISANYLAAVLGKHYPILYTNSKNRVAHEFILDIRQIKQDSGITEEDIAKRLMDYNFHAPTMSFPVAGTLMIEPTESESLDELNRFAEAMIQIREEIKDVKNGTFDKIDNPLKNAPHTLLQVTNDNWTHPYSREVAAFPLSWLKTIGKVWPGVGRINNVQAEKNLMFELPNQSENKI